MLALLQSLLAGAPAPAQVVLTCDPPTLGFWETGVVEARHPEGRPGSWEWSLGTGVGGAFTGERKGPRNVFRAPATAGLARIRVREAGASTWTELPVPVLPPGVLLACNLPPADPDLARMRACTALPMLYSFQEGRLEAGPRPEGPWRWTLAEPCGGTFVGPPSGPGCVYRAPLVLAPRTFHIRAKAEDGTTALQPVRVLPPPLPKALGTVLGAGLLGQVLSPDWSLPALAHFADLPCDPSPHSLHVLQEPEGNLWVVRGPHGLMRHPEGGSMIPMPLQGQLTHHTPFRMAEELPALDCTALAVRPRGAAAHPRPLVAALAAGTSVFLCELSLGGTLQPIAGPAEFAFAPITALAVDGLGGVLVAESARLLRVAPDGDVEPLALRFDGEAPFHALSGLTLDAASGMIYVLDGHALRRIAPDGQVTTLAGHPRQPRAGADFAWGEPAVPGRPCLSGPRDLCFHRGTLFLVDGSVRAFQLATGTLHTLIQGEPALDHPRFGPLRAAKRDSLPEECARIPEPTCLAVAGSRAVVGTKGTLVELDLGALGF